MPVCLHPSVYVCPRVESSLHLYHVWSLIFFLLFHILCFQFCFPWVIHLIWLTCSSLLSPLCLITLCASKPSLCSLVCRRLGSAASCVRPGFGVSRLCSKVYCYGLLSLLGTGISYLVFLELYKKDPEIKLFMVFFLGKFSSVSHVLHLGPTLPATQTYIWQKNQHGNTDWWNKRRKLMPCTVCNKHLNDNKRTEACIRKQDLSYLGDAGVNGGFSVLSKWFFTPCGTSAK